MDVFIIQGRCRCHLSSLDIHGYEGFIGYLQKIGFGGDFEYNCKEVKPWFKQPQSYSVWMLHHKDSYHDRKHHVYILEVSRLN